MVTVLLEEFYYFPTPPISELLLEADGYLSYKLFENFLKLVEIVYCPGPGVIIFYEDSELSLLPILLIYRS